MRAYNIEMLTRSVDRDDPSDKGWCFGLPPGIAPEQWPLDPSNGLPLMHAFTLLLPEDYRCHGPEIVALSVFGTPCDMGDNGPEPSEAIAKVLAPGAPEPGDPDLVALWRANRQHHPRAHWMTDALDGAHALVLLTAEEYAGPPCPPPDVVPCAYRDQLARPRWLEIGSAAAMWIFEFPRWESEDYERYFLYRFLGEVPGCDLAFNRALRVTPRAQDPNAGVPTCDFWHEAQTGYQQPYYWREGKVEPDAYRLHAWAEDHADIHIGGTMRAAQNVPRFSPYHLGFPEEFGGYNFGAGCAQLDFKDMKLDWACG